MSKFWVMKTFMEWADLFVVNGEIGIDEKDADKDWTGYTRGNLSACLTNPRIARRFDQFCKWMNVGDYLIVGVGQKIQFGMKTIGRISGPYRFDSSHQPYRHYRSIEVLRVFESPVPIDKWSQIQRIERVDLDDFIDTLVNY
jgi:hypothetical protein